MEGLRRKFNLLNDSFFCISGYIDGKTGRASLYQAGVIRFHFNFPPDDLFEYYLYIIATTHFDISSLVTHLIISS